MDERCPIVGVCVFIGGSYVNNYSYGIPSSFDFLKKKIAQHMSFTLDIVYISSK